MSQCSSRMSAPALPTLAALLALTLTPSGAALAADKELLDILLGNGAITQDQYETLLAKEKITAKDVAQATVSLDQRGFNVRSGDGAYAVKVGARLHADYTQHFGDDKTGVDATDGTELRRARIEMNGTIARDWRWAAETDLAGDEVSIKDFWLQYQGFEGLTLTVGHQKQPYSLSVEMSSNDIPFVERSVDNRLIIPFVDRAIGARLDASGEHWFFAGGVYGESVPDGTVGDIPTGDEGWGTAGRFVLSPVIDDERVVHLGVRAAYREPSGRDRFIRLRDQTTNFSGLRIVNTGFIGDIDSVALFGPELAFVNGRFSLMSEYNEARISRKSASNLDFSSGHVLVAWTLGDESRAASYRIDNGEFKRIVPDRSFSLAEGGGVWELAARYAWIDLNDDTITGGRQETISTAANWYVNNNVRMMFDWTHILDTDRSNAIRDGAVGLDVITVRAQYTF